MVLLGSGCRTGEGSLGATTCAAQFFCAPKKKNFFFLTVSAVQVARVFFSAGAPLRRKRNFELKFAAILWYLR